MTAMEGSTEQQETRREEKESTEEHEHNSKPSWQKYVKAGVTLVFFIVIPALLYHLLKDMQWQDFRDALQEYSWPVLLGGAGITFLSYLVLSSYDLLGRYQTKHKLRVSQVMPLAFACYTFNLNFGAWLGGIAMRYKLYSGMGLPVPTITAVLGISLLTNWLGYTVLAGILFSMNLIDLPESWGISQIALQLLGGVLLILAISYFLACQFSPRRSWSWRKHKITLPPLKLALLQALMGAANWCLVAALINLLLPDSVNFPTVLAICMVTSIAGAITHIPGGLGVIEAVFISILRNEIPASTVLAAILTFRALYYLLPLPFGVLVYMLLEKRNSARS